MNRLTSGSRFRTASPQDLVSELTRILAYCNSSTPSRAKLASELNLLADRLAAEGEDNSWGRGYFPLPHELSSLGRFADALKPSNLVSHKVFPDEGAHMLTTKLNKVSVMAADMKNLLRLGLLRIQSNEPGTLAFYFGPYPVSTTQLSVAP